MRQDSARPLAELRFRRMDSEPMAASRHAHILRRQDFSAAIVTLAFLQ